MLELYTTNNCVICELVLPAVKAIADKNSLQLNVCGEAEGVPAYPALLYNGALLIGEGIPTKLAQILKGSQD